MKIKAMGAELELVDDTIVINRSGVTHSLNGVKGETRILLSQIAATQFTAAGTVTPGYLQFVLNGAPPPSKRRDKNPHAVGFVKVQEADVVAFRDMVEARRKSPAAPAANPMSIADGLAKLGDLKDRGLLSEDEFTAQKAILMGVTPTTPSSQHEDAADPAHAAPGAAARAPKSFWVADTARSEPPTHAASPAPVLEAPSSPNRLWISAISWFWTVIGSLLAVGALTDAMWPAAALLLASAAMTAPPLRDRIRASAIGEYRTMISVTTAIAGFIAIGVLADPKDGGSNTPAPTTTKPGAATQAPEGPAAPKEKSEKEKYVEQLEREVKSLSNIEPLNGAKLTSKELVILETALIGAWAKIYVDGEKHELSADERALRAKFKGLVSKVQEQRFPVLRAAQARIMDTTLWENDVAAVGAGSRTIRFTAGYFAANRNIKETYQALEEVLRLLRYKRATFEWYRGADGSYYDIDVLSDATLATLENSGWQPVE